MMINDVLEKGEHLLIDRWNQSWIPGCPIMITKIRIIEKDSGNFAVVTSVPCGDFKIHEYTADITFQDRDRRVIGCAENITLTVGESDPVPVKAIKSYYADVTVRRIQFGNGKLWENTDGTMPQELPEQAVFWQTDPLYKTIRSECGEVASYRYQPDELDGAWRCSCGHVNLNESERCGACGCSHEWLREHLNRDYLTKVAAENANKKEEKAAYQKKNR